MIIKASQRAGSASLANHLLNIEDNEQAILTDARFLVAHDVHGALSDMDLLASTSRCQKHLFHVSVNPAEDLSEAQWRRAWELFETEYGLQEQPHIEVTHRKQGRLHKHRVYERVTDQHRAIQLSFTKVRNEYIARQLEHEFGHPLTIGKHNRKVIERLRQEGRTEIADWMEQGGAHQKTRPAAKLDHADCQQQQRTGRTVEQVQADLHAVWQQADNGQSFAAAISEKGYILARGDRRDFVILDSDGGIHSPRRRLDLKAQELAKRWSDLDLDTLPSIEQVRQGYMEIGVTYVPKEIPEQTKEEHPSILELAAMDHRLRTLQEQQALVAAALEQHSHAPGFAAAEAVTRDIIAPAASPAQDTHSANKRHDRDSAQRWRQPTPKEPLTVVAIRRQLQSMDAEEYEIGILTKEGRMLNRIKTADQILSYDAVQGKYPFVSWLQRMNAQDCAIYVRPTLIKTAGQESACNRGLLLVDDLDLEKLMMMSMDDLHPAAFVQTSPGNYQAWIRVSTNPLRKEEATAVARLLAQRYGGDLASVGYLHYGRLAGFTNRKPKYRQPDGKFPFVLFNHEVSTGTLATGGAALLAEARRQLVEERQKQEAAKALLPSLDGKATGALRASLSNRKSALATFVRLYEQEAARRGVKNHSVSDWAICKRMAKYGWSFDALSYAFLHGSPELMKRKKGHVEDYVQRTLTKVFEQPDVQQVRAERLQRQTPLSKFVPGRSSSATGAPPKSKTEQRSPLEKTIANAPSSSFSGAADSYDHRLFKVQEALFVPDASGYRGNAHREYRKELARKILAHGEELTIGSVSVRQATDQDIAVRLRAAGFSLRQVANALNQASPEAAHYESEAKYGEWIAVEASRHPQVRQMIREIRAWKAKEGLAPFDRRLERVRLATEVPRVSVEHER